MTAVNGAVVWSAKYSSFGEAEVDPASTVENNLRSGGQYFDTENSFHYNWNRYYDPITGRYLRPDEKGLSSNINVYNYANNNTPLYIDPNGESAVIAIPVIIGFGVVAIIIEHYRHKPPKGQRPKPWWDKPPKPKPQEVEEIPVETVNPPPPPPVNPPPNNQSPWERYKMCKAVCKGVCGVVKRQVCYKICFVGLIVDSLDLSKLQ